MSIRTILLTGAFFAMICCFARCFSYEYPDPRGTAYAGSARCATCHRNITGHFARTAHFLSTQVATEGTVEGSFVPGANTLTLSAGSVVVMEKTDSGLYQVLRQNGRPVRSGRFDLVMGKVKGQSYLFRRPDGYYQLPVSWFSGLHRWTTSPGFRPGTASFDRPVVARCFACHSAWVSEPIAAHPEQAVYGIDCERCHGPAAAHVRFHTRNPEEKKPFGLVSISRLTREQKVAVCAICHSGTKQTLLRSAFAFQPGDSLSKFFIADYTGTLTPDVHGNQAGLLEKSKCYQAAQMDCSTCHDTHRNERENSILFNQRCTGCHPSHAIRCGLSDSVPAAFLANNCTACHMPRQPSLAIRVQTAADSAATAAWVVNHRIAIYPAETAQLLKRLKP